MSKIRGFEPVEEKFKKYKEKIVVHGKSIEVAPEVVLPTRSDVRSAGYDFYSPIDIQILPAQKIVLWTNVKAYMGEDEVLMLYPRSSMGIKKGLMLANTVGVIDSSYYGNEDNDGNIGLALLNTSGKAIDIKRGDRIVQGVFTKYLVSDNGNPNASIVRKGGIGSTGK